MGAIAWEVFFDSQHQRRALLLREDILRVVEPIESSGDSLHRSVKALVTLGKLKESSLRKRFVSTVS